MKKIKLIIGDKTFDAEIADDQFAEIVAIEKKEDCKHDWKEWLQISQTTQGYFDTSFYGVTCEKCCEAKEFAKPWPQNPKGTTEIVGSEKRWRARVGEKYWCINSLVKIVEPYDCYNDSGGWDYLTGNYHQTKKECQEYKAYLQALGEIKAYVEENGLGAVAAISSPNIFNIITSGFNWIISEGCCNFYSVLPTLKTQKDAQKVIDNCKPQLEIIRNYSNSL